MDEIEKGDVVYEWWEELIKKKVKGFNIKNRQYKVENTIKYVDYS